MNHYHTCSFIVNSYRHALAWDDNTADYFLGVHARLPMLTQPGCGSLSDQPNRLDFDDCWSSEKIYTFLCQLPLQSRHLPHNVRSSSSGITGHHQQTGTFSLSACGQKPPNTVKVKVKLKQLNTTWTGQWWPVTCGGRHLTHVFLACDTLAVCWADGDVTFSRHSDTWASPTSKTCPVPLVGLPLPPSFPCRSLEQRVPYSLVCDHRPDCLDGSDEGFCHFPPCLNLSQFQCHNKQVCQLISGDISFYVL